jgi:hypothetical protein
MYGMNRILTDIGRGSGWLYSAQCFMEFQAYNVLVIASISVSWNIEYTPARILFMKVLAMRPLCEP